MPDITDWKPLFLESLRKMAMPAAACRVVGIERSTAYRQRDKDPEFAKAWDDALEAAVDDAEQEAFRRAALGFNEPVIYKGRQMYVTEPMEDIVDGGLLLGADGEPRMRLKRDAEGNPIPLTVNKFSDTLLSVVLKGRRKKVYAERTELTGADGGPVDMADPEARAARVAYLLQLAQQRAGQDNSDLA